MIPKYPYAVIIEFQPRVKRPPVMKHLETLPGAMAIYNENVGRTDVRRVSVTLTIEQSERWEQARKP